MMLVTTSSSTRLMVEDHVRGGQLVAGAELLGELGEPLDLGPLVDEDGGRR